MWNPGTIQDLLDREQYKPGRVGMEPFRGLLMAERQVQASFDLGNPATTVISNVNGTSQIISSAAGRLYKVRVENLTADPIYLILADSVIAQVIGAVKAVARVSASVPTVVEATWYEDPAGCGETFATSLICRAFKIDGTGTTQAANGVTLYALTSS